MQRMALNKSVATLVRAAETMTAETPLEEVELWFRRNPQLQSIPVVMADRKPLGLIRRHQILSLFALQYGRPLYAKDRAVTAIDTTTLIMEESTLIAAASEQITHVMGDQIESDFMITRHGEYLGIGRVIDLLRAITELQVQNARYANPLTGLPGNVPIYEQTEQLLAGTRPFVAAYCDLDHFKPFNDLYGYSEGDRMIQRLGNLLLRHSHLPHDFVGHVGGDDFIILFQSSDWQRRCGAILEQFAGTVSDFYSPHDVERKGFEALDREGVPTFYPLTSLSIGAVVIQPQPNLTYEMIAQLTTEAKKGAKSQHGNTLFIKTYPHATTPWRPELRERAGPFTVIADRRERERPPLESS